MTHVRQQIREAAATALSGNTDAGTNVFDSLTYPSDVSAIPLVHVHIEEEESEFLNTSLHMQRSASMVVTAVQKGTESTLDNALDRLAVQIEGVLGGNTLSDLSKWTQLVATGVERSGDANEPIGEISLTFQVIYHTAANDAETAL